MNIQDLEKYERIHDEPNTLDSFSFTRAHAATCTDPECKLRNVIPHHRMPVVKNWWTDDDL